MQLCTLGVSSERYNYLFIILILYRSKVVSDYHDRGFVRDKSHDDIHVRNLYMKLIYSVLEENILG